METNLNYYIPRIKQKLQQENPDLYKGLTNEHIRKTLIFFFKNFIQHIIENKVDLTIRGYFYLHIKRKPHNKRQYYKSQSYHKILYQAPPHKEYNNLINSK